MKTAISLLTLILYYVAVAKGMKFYDEGEENNDINVGYQGNSFRHNNNAYPYDEYNGRKINCYNNQQEQSLTWALDQIQTLTRFIQNIQSSSRHFSPHHNNNGRNDHFNYYNRHQELLSRILESIEEISINVKKTHAVPPTSPQILKQNIPFESKLEHSPPRFKDENQNWGLVRGDMGLDDDKYQHIYGTVTHTDDEVSDPSRPLDFLPSNLQPDVREDLGLDDDEVSDALLPLDTSPTNLESDGLRPISLDPIQPDQPMVVQSPAVEHGSYQAGCKNGMLDCQARNGQWKSKPPYPGFLPSINK